MPKRNSTMLTDAGVGKIGKAPAGKRVERFDAGQPGLSIRITERGVKSWSVYYHLADKHHRMTVGHWPAVGVKAARIKAAEVKEQVNAGIDPKVALEGQRIAAREAAQMEAERHKTFEYIAEQFIKRGMRNVSDRFRRDIEVRIRSRLMPAWGDRPCRALGLKDAHRLLDELIDAGKPAAALNLQKTIRRIGNWAEEVGELEISPFHRLKAPVICRPRERILDHDEIRAVWSATDAVGYPFGPFVKLCLITGQRRTEIASMRRRNLDMDKAEWLIPAGSTKSAREHLLHLPTMALDIIESLPEFIGGDHLFTTTSGKTPISGFSKMKSRLDERSGVTGWTLHDLRRTARSEWARIGVPEEVSERLLNHAPKGLVGVYNRHAYSEEKRAGMDRWAAALRDIVTEPPENVVAMTAREAL